MKTIIDKYTGQLLYCREDESTIENEISVDEVLTEYMENPYYDFTTRTFYNKEII